MNARNDRPTYPIYRHARHGERKATMLANGINGNINNGRPVEIMLTDGSRVHVEEARPVLDCVMVWPVGGSGWREVHPEELL